MSMVILRFILYVIFTGALNVGGAYHPCTTSYDYDAPLTEAGDPNQKYHAIKKIVNKYLPDPGLPIPPPTSKYAYGKVQMRKVTATKLCLQPVVSRRIDPLSLRRCVSRARHIV